MTIDHPDYRLLQFMWGVTNEMEGVKTNLPPFTRFDDEGMTVEDVAEVLVALEQHYQRKFVMPYYPECLMDICDYIQGRERESVRLKERGDVSSGAYSFYDQSQNRRKEERLPRNRGKVDRGKEERKRGLWGLLRRFVPKLWLSTP